MSAFSVASELGVPAGLELARAGGWRLPFFSVAGLGLAVAGSALALMPPMRGHLSPVGGSPVGAPSARVVGAGGPAGEEGGGSGVAGVSAGGAAGAGLGAGADADAGAGGAASAGAGESGAARAGGRRVRDGRRVRGAGASILRSRLALVSLSGSAASMLSGFAIIPNIPAFLQLNLGYPRSRLGLLYMVGGAVTFATRRLAGRLVDRAGAPSVAAGATALLLVVLGVGYAFPPAGVPVLPIFVGFMVANSTRNVALNTLSSRVPAPAERARFMSAQSAVQHLAAALGAGLSAQLLSERDGRLAGMTAVALLASAVACALPVAVARVAAGLRARDAAARAGAG
jgi:predicted MFS family arabinose efflux permease